MMALCFVCLFLPCSLHPSSCQVPRHIPLKSEATVYHLKTIVHLWSPVARRGGVRSGRVRVCCGENFGILEEHDGFKDQFDVCISSHHKARVLRGGVEYEVVAFESAIAGVRGCWTMRWVGRMMRCPRTGPLPGWWKIGVDYTSIASKLARGLCDRVETRLQAAMLVWAMSEIFQLEFLVLNTSEGRQER